MVIAQGKVMTMTVTFQHRFSDPDKTHMSVILEESIQSRVDADCRNVHMPPNQQSIVFTSYLLNTTTAPMDSVFKATFACCDLSSSSELISSAQDHALQGEWEERMCDELNLQMVMFSQIQSIALMDEDSILPLSTTTTATSTSTTAAEVDVDSDESVSAVESTMLRDTSWSSWLIRILLLQVLLCCALVACVCSIRLRTRGLVKEAQSVRREGEYIKSPELRPVLAATLALRGALF